MPDHGVEREKSLDDAGPRAGGTVRPTLGGAAPPPVGWIAALADIAGRTSSFCVCYRRLVATKSAVITVADEPNRLSALRRELMPLLHLPGSASAGDLAHITLFRYATPLGDPAALLRWLATTEFHINIDVDELLVVRERVFPSLNYEILHRIALTPASPAQ